MTRFMLSAVAVFVLLFSVFAFPAKVPARKCPVKMPETLLSLYLNSDSIFVARFDRTEIGKDSREYEDYKYVEIKKHFEITSTLKGKDQKTFVLDDEEYVDTTPTEEELQAPEEDDEKLTPGDKVLIFLSEDEDEKKLTLTDYSDGMKKLVADDLAIYELRIKELNSIFKSEKVNHELVVQWLVRCAEHPATRWEGTFELLRSFQTFDWQEEKAEKRRERIAKGEVVEEEAEDEDTGELAKGFEPGQTSVFARLLNDYQKQTLSNLLLYRNRFSADFSQKNSMLRGDSELINLTKRWGDSRLATVLFRQLQSKELSSYQNSELMLTISELLDDENLSELAEEYEEVSYQDNDAEVENEDEEEVSSDSDEQTDQAEAVVNQDETVKETETKAEKETPKKLTYKQLREQLLNKFLTKAEKVLEVESKK